MALTQPRDPGHDKSAAADGEAHSTEPPLEPPSFLVRNRRAIHFAGLTISLVVLGLSAFVLLRTLAGLNWWELRAALAATGWDQISAAVALTAVSYLTLTGYDALALRQLALTVPYRATALASYTSYAISFTLGFPLITGGAVRYWIYSRFGVSAGSVASLTLIAGVTFWLGMGLVVGFALVFDPSGIAEINHLKVSINLLIGLGILFTIGAWLVLSAMGHRRLRIQGLTIDLPGPRLTLAQMALGVLDLCAAGSALYVLLPAGHATEFIHFLAAYVVGCVLGIVSHVPGGIGPFEMTMLKSVTTPTQEGLIASLLMFRVIYYLVPFVLALALIGAYEAGRRWTELRAAMRRAAEEREGNR